MSRLFNGTSDYLEAASWTGMVTTNAGPWTVSAWIKPTGFTANRAAVGYGGTSGITNYWTIFTTSGAVGTLERIAATASDSSGGTFTASSWQHLAAVTTSATSGLVYVKGVAGTVDTTSQALAATINTFDVGVLMDNGNRVDFYAGQIGEVAIWNAALSAGQIGALAAGTSPLSVGTVTNYWQIKGTTSPEPALVGSHTLTVTGTTAEVGDDPPVYPPGGAVFTPHRMPLGC